MPTLLNSEEKSQVTELTGIILKLTVGPTPASASIPDKAPSGTGIPFKLKFFKFGKFCNLLQFLYLYVLLISFFIPP